MDPLTIAIIVAVFTLIVLFSGIPIAFGVLTTHNSDHAFARSGGDKGNIGSSCADTVIETINVIRSV